MKPARQKSRLRDLAEDCPVCRSPAGQRCRNYKGQGKQPCPIKEPAAEAVVPPEFRGAVQRTLFGEDDR